jgi:predicted phage tail protein
MAFLATLRLMLGAMAFHHLAFHLAVHFLAALVLALVLGVLTLLMLSMLCRGVLRMIDGSSRCCLCRCKRNGCEKDVHFVAP